jgi:hypothetical protein
VWYFSFGQGKVLEDAKFSCRIQVLQASPDILQFNSRSKLSNRTKGVWIPKRSTIQLFRAINPDLRGAIRQFLSWH